MSTSLRELERQDTRALCAMRMVDASTGAPLDGRFEVTAVDGTRPYFSRNRSGVMVLTHWAPLASHEGSFHAPPDSPATGSLPLVLRISDPDGGHLPRLARLQLPRNSNPDAPDSVHRVVELPMYPSSAAPTGANWAVLRVVVSESGATADALGGALLRVLRDGEVIARGLTDWRGEALVPVVGVPVTTFAEGAGEVVATEIDVVLEAIFDPLSGVRTPLEHVRAGTPPTPLPLVDPEALEAGLAGFERTQLTLAIAARRQTRRTLTLDLP